MDGVVSAVVVDFVLMASMAMGVGRLYVDSGSSCLRGERVGEGEQCEISTNKYRDKCLFGLSFSGFLTSALASLLVSGIVLCRPGSSAGCCCVSANWHLLIWGHEPHP